MKPLTIDEIRSSFLGFFRERGHTVVSSSPLVPHNDPTLLFTNAGMVQFKDVFTGKESRPYTRATTSQKCVRAGGKHNDLENVGYTARHHTFFEMLGNFSFGDYFKKEAIEYAWTFVTEVLGLPKERLCVTVFRGEGEIPSDEEAAACWEAVGVPKERIFRLGKSENWWQMGDTGPQGPCSEIHYFVADDLDRALDQKRVEASDGWLEIWNLVFMQFQREAVGGPLLELPQPSIDTGAGLERLALVLQGKTSNYDTDAFMPIISGIAKDVGKTYRSSDAPDDVSMRVIADHARATSFLIADGVQPTNEGRGYVLRRIMRRAIRHGSRLGFQDLFFHRACALVVERMKGAYPDLEKAAPLIEKVSQNEEAAFRRTLDRGLKMLKQKMDEQKTGVLEPEFVATMYDTYGFPIDLTRIIANENGLSVDEDAAKSALEKLQSGGKAAELGSDKEVERVWFDVREKVGATNFLGYEKETSESTVRAIVVGGQSVLRAEQGAKAHVVLDQTPFYGEAGGQIGDRGVIENAGVSMQVENATKPRPDLVVHSGIIERGALGVGDRITAKIDVAAREATRKNHSATHLLHLALKQVLGQHVQQKGSLVAPERLRFDYSHFEPVTAEQIEAIEKKVNEWVLKDAPTQTSLCSLDEARASGAVMLFGEKYGDEVRMVRIGGDSLELCGGTHVRRAGEIGLIKIVSEGALASGIRRMEAVSGLGSLEYVQKRARLLEQVAGLTKCAPEETPERIERMLKRVKELERDLEKAKAQAALGGGGAQTDLLDRVEDVKGVRVLAQRLDGTPAKTLREVSDKLRDRLQSGVVILGTTEGDKAALLVAVTKDLTSSIHAGKIVQLASGSMEGSGGGRPDFAQGGGKAALLDAGLARAKQAIAEVRV